MKNLKKIVSLFAAAALAAAVLAGCGGNADNKTAAAAKAPADVCDAILEANPIDNKLELTENNLKLDFMLDTESIAAFKGVQSNDQDNAGLVLVIECKDGKAEEVAAALTQYKADQEAYWALYPEFAEGLQNVKDGFVGTSGKLAYVVFPSSSAESADAVGNAIQNALK